MTNIPIASLCIAGAAVIATPLTTWLITNRQLAHNAQMQELRLLDEMQRQKLELVYRSNRDWCNSLRERVSLLIGLSTDVLFVQEALDLRIVTNAFTSAQAQVEILVSSDTTAHINLRRLVSELATLLRTADIRSSKSSETLDKIAKLRREIVNTTREIVESTLSQEET